MLPNHLRKFVEQTKEGYIVEGKVRIKIPPEVYERVSRKLEAFYNPLSAIGRDIMVELVSKFNVKQGADLLCSTGIRGLRLLVESGLEEMYFNDYNRKAIKYLLENIEINKEKWSGKQIYFSSLDARYFVDSKFEYLELDPYGSANPFLILMESVKYKGFLGVTFTDTGPLTGSKWRKAKLKYHVNLRKSSFYLEVGLRVLIKHIIEKGAELEFAMLPVYGHHNYHYYRAYFQKLKGSKRIEELVEQISYINWCPNCDYREVSEKQESKNCPICGKRMLSLGPLYVGEIWRFELSKRDYFLKESNKTIERINKEKEIQVPYYYDLHFLSSKLKQSVLSISKVIESLRELGYKAERTHFTDKGIRTDAEYKELVNVLRQN